ncbi:MAG TPA: metal-sensing transcriptional repressor [Anaerolineales bacterium]|jgi:DNA-binding FrmR family transcriptional regulator|nr:metal-sensing transcriptional repressor [Anaerolineales bacterium]
MPQKNRQSDLAFRADVALGHLAAVRGMLENKAPMEKILHQICAVQAALEKIKANIQSQLLEEGISAIRANPCGEVNEQQVDKLISLYTTFHTKR